MRYTLIILCVFISSVTLSVAQNQQSHNNIIAPNSPLSLLDFDIQKRILNYRRFWKTSFDNYIVNWRDIAEGGPARDKIQAIDNPKFREDIDKIDIPDNEAVIVMYFANNVIKAYPLRYLIWHEIINDTHDELHYAVTYNVLYGSFHVFSRQLDNKILTFSSTGKLHLGNNLLYDRDTESWWQQATAKAIVGNMTNSQLPSLTAHLMPYGAFKRLIGHHFVMKKPDDDSFKPYGKSAYAQFTTQQQPFSFPQAYHPFLPLFEPVVSLNNRQLAISWRILQKHQRIALPNNIIVRWLRGMANPVDEPFLANGADMGYVMVEQWGKPLQYHLEYAYAHYLLAPNARYIDEQP